MPESAAPAIVPFTMEVYPEVYALWQSCAGIGLSGADAAPQINAYLERNPGMSYIARDGGRIIGAILAGHDGRRGYIHHLAVQPEKRRRGLASRLVERSLESLRRAGIQKCHLFIYQDNHAGIRFWEAAGWKYRNELGLISRTLVPGSDGDC